MYYYTVIITINGKELEERMNLAVSVGYEFVALSQSEDTDSIHYAVIMRRLILIDPEKSWPVFSVDSLTKKD